MPIELPVWAIVVSELRGLAGDPDGTGVAFHEDAGKVV